MTISNFPRASGADRAAWRVREQHTDEMQLSKFGRSTAIGFSFNKALSLPLSLVFRLAWNPPPACSPARPPACLPTWLPGCSHSLSQQSVSVESMSGAVVLQCKCCPPALLLR
jgi:hypothetical protein